jgi:hypothetical protein
VRGCAWSSLQDTQVLDYGDAGDADATVDREVPRRAACACDDRRRQLSLCVRPLLQVAKLVLIDNGDGRGAGEERMLQDGENTIGRLDDNMIWCAVGLNVQRVAGVARCRPALLCTVCLVWWRCRRGVER